MRNIVAIMLMLLVVGGYSAMGQSVTGQTVTFTVEEQKEIDEFVKEYGNDVKRVDNNGEPLLHRAVRRGKVVTMKYLVSKGADVNAKNKWGETPLHIGLGLEEVEVVKYLMSVLIG